MLDTFMHIETGKYVIKRNKLQPLAYKSKGIIIGLFRYIKILLDSVVYKTQMTACVKLTTLLKNRSGDRAAVCVQAKINGHVYSISFNVSKKADNLLGKLSYTVST